MAEITILAYPYASQSGTLVVPDELPEDKYHDYVKNHWKDVSFNEPNLDYAGTDFEITA